MTKEEFQSLSFSDLEEMTAIEIWQFIVDYFHSNSLTYEDEYLNFVKEKNLKKMKSEEKAWRYAVDLYDYYCSWG